MIHDNGWVLLIQIVEIKPVVGYIFIVQAERIDGPPSGEIGNPACFRGDDGVALVCKGGQGLAHNFAIVEHGGIEAVGQAKSGLRIENRQGCCGNQRGHGQLLRPDALKPSLQEFHPGERGDEQNDQRHALQGHKGGEEDEAHACHSRPVERERPPLEGWRGRGQCQRAQRHGSGQQEDGIYGILKTLAQILELIDEQVAPGKD